MKTRRIKPPLYGRKRRIAIRSAIVVVLVAPLLVAAAWMWSMWDPSHYLDEVKIALVNEDEGTTQEGEKVSFGDDIEKGLLDTSYLNVDTVSADAANKGMKEGTYMATISIPRDFSDRVATVIDDKPRQAEVVISYNDHYGTNTPLLTSGLIPGIQAGIQSGITEGYSSEILDGMNQLGDGLNEAADGAVQLDDGATMLKDGTEQGIDGAHQLKDGTGQLRDGAAELDNGLSQLVDGTGQLGDGAAQIDDGVGQLTDKLIPLARQAGAAAEQLKPMIGVLRTFQLNKEADKLQEIVAGLDNNNPDGIANQLQMLKDGTAEMSYNLNNPNAPYLSGVLQLKDGTTQLREGSVELDEGMGQMLDGTYQLDDGVRQLKDGTTQLRTGLVEGSEQAPSISNIQASSHQMAVPVVYSQDYQNPVQELKDLNDPTSKQLSGGVTFILILVFGFLMMVLVSMLAPHILGRYSHRRPLWQVLGGFAIVAAANTALLFLLTWLGTLLGFSVDNRTAFALGLVILAANGTAFFQLLRIAFGRLIGGTLALGFFAYGVFSFGGVWPIQLTPKPLRLLHDIHPMTYARNLFIGAVEGDTGAFYLSSAFLLLVMTIVCLIISVLIVKRRERPAVMESEDGTTPEDEEAELVTAR
ncbi:ABC-2 family transporter protein [Corynebacterium ciconiae DSM 44920]|uniref:YhgE/Pip family protein n=1 Tax=Corynebacterium ciconiae TaxID=227319 RepID=UPI00036C7711|nr:YhgE/Pip family protein [Corynebacterium ciconiae]WKD61271.1 ABC-2 family transporter protein [Corynebacterium ciconiae DSM 44920]